MNTLLIVAILFILTAIFHVATLFVFGTNQNTVPVAIYGLIYLALGILLILGTFSWTPVVALVLTAIGIVGALSQLNAIPAMRSWGIGFIVVDVVVIGLLLVNIL